MKPSTPIDQLILHFDTALRTITGSVGPTAREVPKTSASEHRKDESELSESERLLSSRLMRVNHCGEVCAQALYHGQALTAKTSRTSGKMKIAAAEEADHLSWCESRISDLGSHVSYLNPLFYAASFTTGAIAGLLGDKISLGFIAATEDEVCRHLDEHIKRMPVNDETSRIILEGMREDEARHAQTAIKSGGVRFPAPVKGAMRAVSRLMTQTTYWF